MYLLISPGRVAFWGHISFPFFMCLFRTGHNHQSSPSTPLKPTKKSIILSIAEQPIFMIPALKLSGGFPPQGPSSQATRVQLDSDSQAWLLPARVLTTKRCLKKETKKKPSYSHKITETNHSKSVVRSLLCGVFFLGVGNQLDLSCFWGGEREKGFLSEWISCGA